MPGLFCAQFSMRVPSVSARFSTLDTAVFVFSLSGTRSQSKRGRKRGERQRFPSPPTPKDTGQSFVSRTFSQPRPHLSLNLHDSCLRSFRVRDADAPRPELRAQPRRARPLVPAPLWPPPAQSLRHRERAPRHQPRRDAPRLPRRVGRGDREDGLARRLQGRQRLAEVQQDQVEDHRRAHWLGEHRADLGPAFRDDGERTRKERELFRDLAFFFDLSFLRPFLSSTFPSSSHLSFSLCLFSLLAPPPNNSWTTSSA